MLVARNSVSLLPRGDNDTPCFSLPSCPPPLVCVSPQNISPLPTEPLELGFIGGNISVCYGCRQKYAKPSCPPNDLYVKHKEWREYFPLWTCCTSIKIWQLLLPLQYSVYTSKVPILSSRHAEDTTKSCSAVTH